ncbi:hypothetical protein HY483_00540 [Candidatus Woesearchaeota archaeon]|nr:hypothetical protein [Candidatus Woesearchaeota archaeon]
MPQYTEHVLLLGGIVSTGVKASSMHHLDEHYDHLYAALRSGARISRITLVYGRPVEGFFGLQFDIHNEQEELEQKILRLNKRKIAIGFGPRLNDFLQKDDLSISYVDKSRNIHGLRSFPVQVPTEYEFLSMEEIFENIRRESETRRKSMKGA